MIAGGTDKPSIQKQRAGWWPDQEIMRVLDMVQEPSLAKPQLAKLQPLIDSCFMPALHYRDRGRTAPQALDDIALDLLTIAQVRLPCNLGKKIAYRHQRLHLWLTRKMACRTKEFN